MKRLQLTKKPRVTLRWMPKLSKGPPRFAQTRRLLVEAAERDALAGLLTEATEALGAALQIDPGNTIVQERLVQLKAMEDEPNAKRNRESPACRA